MAKQSFVVTNDTGLHARPATMVVNKAGQFQSEIQITYKEKSVNLKSIMGVMSLGVAKGAEITISADGNDEDKAIQGIIDCFKDEKIGELQD